MDLGNKDAVMQREGARVLACKFVDPMTSATQIFDTLAQPYLVEKFPPRCRLTLGLFIYVPQHQPRQYLYTINVLTHAHLAGFDPLVVAIEYNTPTVQQCFRWHLPR